MARGRTQNRMEKRAEHEAYERQQAEGEETVEDEEEGDEDEDEDEEEEASADKEADAEEGEPVDEEDAPPKKKKKAKVVKEPKKAKPRTRTAKIVRMKLVWKVFNNSNQPVATYEYRQKREADEHAARLTTDKKSTHFVQPVKEAIEEKKEA
jgi:hypothetical protein